MAKDNSPLVTVLLPVFNGAIYLDQAIQSILTQTYSNFEFIIINDGSTDKTKNVLHHYSDTRIKVITNQTNQGIVTSLNQGIKAATGKYIARMDADDLSDSKRLTKQVEFLENNRDYVLVGSFTQVIDEDGTALYTIEQPSRNAAIKRNLQNNSCIAHGSVMMRKKVVDKIEGYSLDKKVLHAEDYDLFIRMAGLGKIANIPSNT